MPSVRKGNSVKFNTAEGHRYKTKNGKTIKLLDIDQKSRRFAKELKVNCNVYTGEKLTKSQKAYRLGFLKYANESAKVYNSKINKKKVKK